MIVAIHAIGKRGSVKGKTFSAQRTNGKYELHSEKRAAMLGIPLNYAATKVFVDTLEEAAKLIESGGYHLRVTNAETGQCNKRRREELQIVRR